MSEIKEKDIEEIKRAVEKKFPTTLLYSKFISQGKSLLKKRDLKD